jgi:drug/metabolite transporter (DMT)-like permease
VIAGLLLAVGCALTGSVAVLLKQRGAVAAPTVSIRHPVRSASGLFGSRWWTLGWLVALGAWMLHVGALSLASLSIVQAVISGGLVFVAILAERFFGLHLGRRQWIGVLVTAVGLTILGLTQAPATRQHASAAALIAVECAVMALSGALICASMRLERPHLGEGILLATAAGALFGVSDIAIKHLVHPALTHVMVLVNPWTLSALIAMVVAFYASARSLQLGPAIAVITFTSLTSNIVTLLGGIVVFHDPIGVGGAQIAARIVAFCLVILGAALLPGRLRAGAQSAEEIRFGGSRARLAFRHGEVAEVEVIDAACQGEYSVDVRAAAQENQSTPSRSSASTGVDDRVHGRGVHELELAQIENEKSDLESRLAQRLLQLRHRRKIELTGKVHPGSMEATVSPRANELGRRSPWSVGE